MSEALPYLNIEPDETEDGVIPTTTLWSGFSSYLEETGQLSGGLGNTQIGGSEEAQGGPEEQPAMGNNIPQPPESNEELDLNNDVQSDGITNEDAGF